MQAIELRNASYRYEGNEKFALKNINLTIESGEILAIAGKNGSGKTTLAKLIQGLLKPTSGEVYVNGKRPEPGKSKIGLVFQNPLHQLFCESVNEEIAFGLKNLPKSEKEQRIDTILKEHELFNYRDKHPLALSEGERKALALASILAMDPDFLILDEPTLGQDLFYQQRLKALIKSLAKNGKGIILISHDLEFISTVAQRVILLLDGEIIADGEAEDILFNEELLEKCGLTMPAIPKLVKLLSLNSTLSEGEILSQLMKMRGMS
jgi:energy-coupling factor transport system ATP-binding protein